MNAARRLHSVQVQDCPQRDGEPIKRLMTGDGKFFVFGHDGYGCKPIEPMPHNPTADELTWRVRAQSLLTKPGHRGELPATKEEAMRIITEHEG